MRPALLALLVALAPLAGCFDVWDSYQNRRTGPGESALEFIQGERRVVVELHHVDGAGPNADALAALKQEIGALLGKTVEIVQQGGVAGKGATHRYTWDEVRGLEGDVRTMWTDDTRAVLFMLYLDGGSEGDSADGESRVLGAAYQGSSTVIFKGNVRASSTENPGLINLENKPSELAVERAVLVHEAGHILGLVNHGIGMVKDHEMTEDPVPETPRNEGKGHSKNRESVMHWAVESSDVIDLFFLQGSQSIPYRFDADDKADVEAARG